MCNLLAENPGRDQFGIVTLSEDIVSYFPLYNAEVPRHGPGTGAWRQSRRTGLQPLKYAGTCSL